MQIDNIKQMVLEDVDPKLREEKRRRRNRAVLFSLIEFIAIIVIVCVSFQIMFGVTYVEGDSMYPTLHDKNMVLYNRRSDTYARGDVVAIEMSEDDMYVKRVAAVAGDTVNIENGSVFINGEEYIEERALGLTYPDGTKVSYPLTVPESEVFVLGDNREISDDSRDFGPVETEQIKGRLIWYIGTL